MNYQVRSYEAMCMITDPGFVKRKIIKISSIKKTLFCGRDIFKQAINNNSILALIIYVNIYK